MVRCRGDQAFKERMKNHVLWLTAGELRIERGRFAAVSGQENAGAIGRLHTRGPVRPDVMKPRDAAAEEDEDESTKKPAHPQT